MGFRGAAPWGFKGSNKWDGTSRGSRGTSRHSNMGQGYQGDIFYISVYSQCLTSGCTGHVIKHETRVTYQGIESLHLWREKKPDDLHTAGATISYQLSCSENHNNLWSTSEFYNSSNQVTAYHRVLLIQFVILQGRSVSVLNAKLSTFGTKL